MDVLQQPAFVLAYCLDHSENSGAYVHLEAYGDRI